MNFVRLSKSTLKGCKTMTEISNCPKCGGKMEITWKWIRDKRAISSFQCSVCVLTYYVDNDITDEENLAAWNDQPVIAALRAGIQNTLDLARTGLKPDHYASEVEWLQHKINVIASELAGLLKG
jgi:hypothetical protein